MCLSVGNEADAPREKRPGSLAPAGPEGDEKAPAIRAALGPPRTHGRRGLGGEARDNHRQPARPASEGKGVEKRKPPLIMTTGGCERGCGWEARIEGLEGREGMTSERGPPPSRRIALSPHAHESAQGEMEEKKKALSFPRPP
eukprot:scaffold290811_cov38-Tisochrysis_lutea.AAC.1